jgi:hypothetical protein
MKPRKLWWIVTRTLTGRVGYLPRTSVLDGRYPIPRERAELVKRCAERQLERVAEKKREKQGDAADPSIDAWASVRKWMTRGEDEIWTRREGDVATLDLGDGCLFAPSFEEWDMLVETSTLRCGLYLLPDELFLLREFPASVSVARVSIAGFAYINGQTVADVRAEDGFGMGGGPTLFRGDICELLERWRQQGYAGDSRPSAERPPVAPTPYQASPVPFMVWGGLSFLCLVGGLVLANRHDAAKARARAIADRRLELSTASPPLLADLNGDGVSDWIAAGTYGVASAPQFFAFDGRSGRALWETPELGSSPIKADVLSGDYFLLVQARELRAFDAGGGASAWRTALKEDVQDYCLTERPNSLRVLTQRGAMLELDLASGSLTATNDLSPCRHANANVLPPPLPLASADPDAPRDVRSIACGKPDGGGPDPCQAKYGFGQDHFGAIRLAFLWELREGLLGIGFAKDHDIPAVALMDAHSLRWMAEVPTRDHDEARALHVAIADSVLIAGCDFHFHRPVAITAFDLKSGRRLFDTALPPEFKGLRGLSVGQGLVLALGESAGVAGIALPSGQTLFVVGQ